MYYFNAQSTWPWETSLGMMTALSFLITCILMCIATQKKRRDKGVTLAQAYHIPQVSWKKYLSNTSLSLHNGKPPTSANALPYGSVLPNDIRGLY